MKRHDKKSRGRFFNPPFSPGYTILGIVFVAFFLAYCAADGSSSSGDGGANSGNSGSDSPMTDLNTLPETIRDLKFDFTWRTKAEATTDAARPYVSWNDTATAADGAGYTYLLRYAFYPDLDDTSHSSYVEKRFAVGTSTFDLSVDDVRNSSQKGGGFFSPTRLWHFQIVKYDAANEPVSRSAVERIWLYKNDEQVIPSINFPFRLAELGERGASVTYGPARFRHLRHAIDNGPDLLEQQYRLRRNTFKNRCGVHVLGFSFSR